MSVSGEGGRQQLSQLCSCHGRAQMITLWGRGGQGVGQILHIQLVPKHSMSNDQLLMGKIAITYHFITGCTKNIVCFIHFPIKHMFSNEQGS